MYLFDSNGRKHKVEHLNWIERVTKLKQTSGSNPWPVIDECFNYWAEQSPKRYRSFLVSIDNTRKTRKDPKFASTTDKETGGILRYTLDIPEEVMFMIRCIYTVDELPMDKEFFNFLAKRFPRFKIANKI